MTDERMAGRRGPMCGRTRTSSYCYSFFLSLACSSRAPWDGRTPSLAERSCWLSLYRSLSGSSAAITGANTAVYSIWDLAFLLSPLWFAFFRLTHATSFPQFRTHARAHTTRRILCCRQKRLAAAPHSPSTPCLYGRKACSTWSFFCRPPHYAVLKLACAIFTPVGQERKKKIRTEERMHAE